MGNRDYTDIRLLRKDVNDLIDQNRFRWTHHASTDHSEIPLQFKLAVVRWGARDARDKDASKGPKFLCWAIVPGIGECRASFAVIETPGNGAFVLIISVFKE